MVKILKYITEPKFYLCIALLFTTFLHTYTKPLCYVNNFYKKHLFSKNKSKNLVINRKTKKYKFTFLDITLLELKVLGIHPKICLLQLVDSTEAPEDKKTLLSIL